MAQCEHHGNSDSFWHEREEARVRRVVRRGGTGRLSELRAASARRAGGADGELVVLRRALLDRPPPISSGCRNLRSVTWFGEGQSGSAERCRPGGERTATLETSLPRPADADPILLDNPQRLRHRVAVKCHEHLADQPEDSVAVRLGQPNDDDSRGLVRRIGADIREVEIQRQQYPAFTPEERPRVPARGPLRMPERP